MAKKVRVGNPPGEGNYLNGNRRANNTSGANMVGPGGSGMSRKGKPAPPTKSKTKRGA